MGTVFSWNHNQLHVRLHVYRKVSQEEVHIQRVMVYITRYVISERLINGKSITVVHRPTPRPLFFYVKTNSYPEI